MTELERAYRRGYSAGYQDGLAAAKLGKTEQPVLLEMPLEALGLSIRALNCLRGANCQRVAEAAWLSEEDIHRMRGLGRKTADEIACNLNAHGIFCTAWDDFML